MIIKVCGINDLANAQAVDRLAIDWIGINFYHPSSRFIGHQVIRDSVHKKLVGVFVNPTLAFLHDMVSQHGIDIIQLHGDESPDFCAEVHQNFQVDMIKAVGVETILDIQLAMEYHHVQYLLFDKKSKFYGGTGRKFDWNLLAQYQLDIPFLVAGGIGPDDIAIVNTFEHEQFAGVDINSKFELRPGIKDIPLIEDFLKKLNPK